MTQWEKALLTAAIVLWAVIFDALFFSSCLRDRHCFMVSEQSSLRAASAGSLWLNRPLHVPVVLSLVMAGLSCHVLFKCLEPVLNWTDNKLWFLSGFDQNHFWSVFFWSMTLLRCISFTYLVLRLLFLLVFLVSHVYLFPCPVSVLNIESLCVCPLSFGEFPLLLWWFSLECFVLFTFFTCHWLPLCMSHFQSVPSSSYITLSSPLLSFIVWVYSGLFYGLMYL